MSITALSSHLGESGMPFHKYKIGQRVTYRPFRQDASPESYTVTALLPERDGEFKYRIRRLARLLTWSSAKANCVQPRIGDPLPLLGRL
jgi:hypothetical protein